jgi:hypothetical protein
VDVCIKEVVLLSAAANVSCILPELGCGSTCIESEDICMESFRVGACDFSLAPSASLATCDELLCSTSFSCSGSRSIGLVVVAVAAVVVICDSGWSLDRETFRPALAIEVRLDSGLDVCFRKAIDSGGLEIGLDSGFDKATGSLFDCINAAMDKGCLSPAWNG